MQNSLEARSPFLSPALIEFANRLPDTSKCSRTVLKLLLRERLMAKNFPRTIYEQYKQGFTFPIARWLKKALKPVMDETLCREVWKDGLIDTFYLEKLMNDHLAGRQNNYRILFNLMVFRKWLDKYPQVTITFISNE